MVRAINRIIGSEIEQRTLSTFNYGSPAPNRESRSQWIGKQQPKLPGVKRDGKNEVILEVLYLEKT
jgi:hypothetical protein